MNRIQRVRQENVVSASEVSLDAALFTPASRDDNHALFAPMHYESRYAYPLLIWLHAPGPNDERSCCGSCRW